VTHDAFGCWKCGARIEHEPMPLSREARCRACEADLHVCRQCRWYDTGKAKDCAEPVADEVRDKERANFCGYFAIEPDAHAGSTEADAARARLQALFGLEGAGAPADGAAALSDRRRREADAAREELGRLFGLGEDKGS
jgi:hypothetical protein